jgi:hypothetical protein
MAKLNYTAAQFIKAIPKSGGIVSTIAAKVGCDWHTAKKWITEAPTVAKAYQDECETVNDMAQAGLIKAMQEGDVGTIKWWLARKRRGEFGDNLDVTSGGEPLKVIIEYAGNDTDAE